jgi:uncharacterized sulfatase
LDWFPTLLSAAHVELPAAQPIRGRDLRPLIEGRASNWENDLYGEYSQHHYTQAHLRMYRTPEWKLVRDFAQQGRDELYHLAADPEERANLIDNGASRDARERLNEKLLACMRQLGDPLVHDGDEGG